MLKNPGFILVSFLLILSCSNERTKSSGGTKLVEGTFYTDKRVNSDTIIFQSKKPASRLSGWSTTVWRISKDSIFRQDSRGLFHYLGKADCSYSLKGDLLTLKYRSRNGCGIDKYKVLKSGKKQFELIELESTYTGEDNKTRSDIQLR